MSAKEHAQGSRRSDEDDDLRRPAPDSEEPLAEDSQAGTPAAPDLNGVPLGPEAWLSLQQVIGNSAVGGLVEQRKAGQPVPPKTRQRMEASFGRDFGQVALHSGPEVDQAAQSLDAAAFTIADDIFVRSDLPGVEKPLGQAVLGEELAHVAEGVGRKGISRITDPDETVEREAHTAGLEAATGERVYVRPAPEARGAIARLDLVGVIAAATTAVSAATAEPTELKDEEKDRLRAGALEPLNELWTQLGAKMAAAPGGKVPADALQAISDNAGGIGKFIASFTGPPAVQPTLDAAAVSAATGRNALMAAIDPEATTQSAGQSLASTGSEIDGLATPPKPATAPGATPAPDANADSLTPAEADQLKYGAAQPLKSAGDQLAAPKPDFDSIIARLKGVPGVLRSFTKPAAVVPQLHRKAIKVEVDVRTLEAIHGGAKVAITTAMDEWRNAIGLLQGLTAKSAGGGTPTKSEAPASGDDEDKNKPK